MIEAVLFDVAGVLLRPDPVAVFDALAAGGLHFDPNGDVERAHYAGVAHIDEQSGLASARPSYLRVFVEVLGVPRHSREEAAEVLLELWTKHPLHVFRTPCRGVPEGLRRLVDDGFHCGVVSNSDGSVESQLRDSRICQVGEGEGVPVSCIVDSHVVGFEKPDPRIFLLGLQGVGAEPASTVYVGDSRRYDVTGAAAAGIVPLHFDPFRLCPDDSHGHLLSLTEVSAHLDDMSA